MTRRRRGGGRGLHHRWHLQRLRRHVRAEGLPRCSSPLHRRACSSPARRSLVLDGDEGTGQQPLCFVDQTNHAMRIGYYTDTYRRTARRLAAATRSMTFLRRSGDRDAGRAHDPTRPAPTGFVASTQNMQRSSAECRRFEVKPMFPAFRLAALGGPLGPRLASLDSARREVGDDLGEVERRADARAPRRTRPRPR